MTLTGSQELVSVDFVRPIVTVTFDTTTHAFDFDRRSVTMKYAGRIILQKSPANAPWKFQGATVKDDMLHQFRPAIQPEGATLHIFDELLDATKKSYSYNVTVSLDGESFTSDDPVIVNEPQ